MPEKNHSDFAQPGRCSHCGTPLQSSGKTLSFCCKGCEFIYKTLNGFGLQSYYRLIRTSDDTPFQALGAESKNYLHFDDPQINSGWIEKLSEDNSRISFYLPAIHCAACVWLLEKLPSVLKGVSATSVNFSQGKIEITFNPETVKLSEIGQTLNSLGYAPVPVTDYRSELQDRKSNRIMLLRIGVAGFCAANTMMLSVSIFESFYSGIEDQYGHFLRWFSAAIALPAVLYAAAPFYRTAIAALLTGSLHIDLPIAAAIILAYLAGIHACINGDQFVYFDSITTLIFLLLVGRYIQSKAISKARASTVSSWDLLPSSIRVVTGSAETVKPLKELVAGDILKVLPGERIPADGITVQGESSVDYSFLTGESIPQSVQTGTEVFGGAINLESELQIRTSRSAADSRIGKILTEIDRQQTLRTKAEDKANRLSSYFVAIVFSFSVIAYFIWEYLDSSKSFDVVVAFLTVTCPCALGLAIPAAASIALSRAKKRGIFIRRSDAFEAVSEAENFYFDKTRTLTSGNLQVEDSDLLPDADLKILKALSTCGSAHPVAISLASFCEKKSIVAADGLTFRHHPGKGIGCIDQSSCNWRIGSLKWAQELNLEFNARQQSLAQEWQKKGYSVNIFSRDQEVCGIFALSDTVCPEADRIISFLKGKGKNIFILSGDSSAAVREVASKTGIKPENAYGELLPEQKLELITGKSCMIGDGLNDAQSMKGSFVSIGLRGGIEATIEVASIFIASGKLSDLDSLIRASFMTSGTISRNIKYAVIYNIAGGTLALAGLVNPLLAAFVMPLSSLTIIFHSLANKAFKE